MYISATGMSCPLGHSAAAACAALRAGIAKFDELPYRDNKDQPIIAAALTDLSFDLNRFDRLAALLTEAVADCLGKTPPAGKLALLLGLAEPSRPGNPAAWGDRLVQALEANLGIKFAQARCFAAGHVAGFEALRAARDWLQNVPGPCLVCAVDSYIHAGSLLWLDHTGRLKTAENSNGVIPGEAAAALLVQSGPPRPGPVVQIAGLGFAVEPAHVLSEEPLLGKGLAEAVRQSLAEAKRGMHEIDFRLSDVTGEVYGFKELSLARSRLMRQRREEMPVWHAADGIGDTGAAAGLVQLIVAHRAFQRGYAPGNVALCHGSAVPGARAAAVLHCSPAS